MAIATLVATLMGAAAAMGIASPALAADTCYTDTANYTLSNGFHGFTTFKLCASGQFVKTFGTQFETLDTHAHWGTLIGADNQNHGYSSARARFDPNTPQGVSWDVNMNWYNGWRACGNFRYDGVDPAPPGYACIKLSNGKFVAD